MQLKKWYMFFIDSLSHFLSFGVAHLPITVTYFVKMSKMRPDLSDFWSMFLGHCHSGIARVTLVHRYTTWIELAESTVMLMRSCLNIKVCKMKHLNLKLKSKAK